MEWRRLHPRDALWPALLQANARFISLVSQLTDPAGIPAVRSAFRLVRSLLKEIGTSAGTAIEPESQTQLLEETWAIQGVVCAGCPGAGGEDAVFALVWGEPNAVLVEKFWAGRVPLVCPLFTRESKDGIRIE